MASRRFGHESAETRSALLDRAEQIISESGYAALSSRQLGKAAGLSPQIVYYYFRTMDDLFVALVSRSTEHYMQAIEEARSADQPLLALWEISCDRERAVVVQELMALANHRKALMKQLSDFGRDFHEKQAEIVEAEIAAKRLDARGLPADVIAAILEVMARGFAAGAGYDLPANVKAQDYITTMLRGMAGTANRKRPAEGKQRAPSAD